MSMPAGTLRGYSACHGAKGATNMEFTLNARAHMLAHLRCFDFDAAIRAFDSGKESGRRAHQCCHFSGRETGPTGVMGVGR